MPTVLDAFFIEVGLDPAKFSKGAKDIAEDLRKMEEGARKGGKQVEESAGKMGDSLGQVATKMLELATLFTGGVGIVAFMGYVVKSAAELGRLSKVLDTNAQDLWAWEKIGQQVGATSGEVSGSWQKLVHTFNDFAIGLPAANAKFLRFFTEQGVQFTDAQGKLRSMTEVYMQLAKVVEGMDPARAEAYLRGLGLSPGTINLILQGTTRLATSLAEMKKNAPTPDEIRRMEEAQAKWNKELAKTETLGREIASSMLPGFNSLLELIEKIAGWTKSFVTDLDTASRSPFFTWLHSFGDTKKTLGGVHEELNRRRRALGLPEYKGPDGGDQGVGGAGTNFNDRFGTWQQNSRGQSGPGAGAAAGAAAAAGPGTNAYLQQQRAPFAEELKDPETRKLAGAITSAENPGAGPGVMESLMNRTALVNSERAKHGLPPLTLRDMMLGHPSIDRGRSFYGPVRNGAIRSHLDKMNDPTFAARMNGNIDRALGGSNVTRGYTDQGSSGDPNYNAGGVGVNINGERFNDWSYPGARAFRERQQQAAAGAGQGDTWGNNARAVPWLTNPAAFALLPGGRSTSNNTTNSSTAETHVGSVTVHTQATDAYGIAKDMKSALERFGSVGNANNGPN